MTSKNAKRPFGADIALIVIDPQNDFMPGGALAVNGGNEIVPIVNQIAPLFENVVITQDWHPEGHASFASSHEGKNTFEVIQLPYGTQVLWPDHCIQKSYGALVHQGIDIPHALLVARKGTNRLVDSYSAFNEADASPTGLAGYLKERKVSCVFLAGLATDFCVAWSAIDAVKHSFETYVIEDACRAIDLNGSLKKAWTDMLAVGVNKMSTSTLRALAGKRS